MAMSVVYANVGGRIACECREGVVSHYVPDCQGSTIAQMDEAGTVTDTYDYWSYGEERFHGGPSVTRMTFLGMWGYVKDVLNKLYYVRARHLRPNLARWQTLDPLWPDMPAYGYVYSEPTVLADALGLGPGQGLGPGFGIGKGYPVEGGLDYLFV